MARACRSNNPPKHAGAATDRRISSASSPTPPLIPGGEAATGWLAASGDTSLIATLSRAGTSSVLICYCPMPAVFFAPGGHISPSDLHRPERPARHRTQARPAPINRPVHLPGTRPLGSGTAEAFRPAIDAALQAGRHALLAAPE